MTRACLSALAMKRHRDPQGEATKDKGSRSWSEALQAKTCKGVVVQEPEGPTLLILYFYRSIPCISLHRGIVERLDRPIEASQSVHEDTLVFIHSFISTKGSRTGYNPFSACFPTSRFISLALSLCTPSPGRVPPTPCPLSACDFGPGLYFFIWPFASQR